MRQRVFSLGPGDILRRAIDAGLMFTTAVLVLALVLKAALCVDANHDTWWYHLPWAARLAGLSPAESYIFDDYLNQYFAGFPVLMEWLQGQLWRLTGRVESINFVALASLLLYVVFLRWRFGVRVYLALPALMAVPLIHIHATAGYVDLPANLALSCAILLLVPLAAAENTRRRADLVLFLFACAVTAHAKLQLIPVVALVFAAGIAGALVARVRASGPVPPGRLLAGALALLFVASALFYVPIRNAVRFGNPFYPLAMQIGPIELAGPQGREGRGQTERLADLRDARLKALAGAAPSAGGGFTPVAPMRPNEVQPVEVRSNPLVWVRSVLEIGIEPLVGRGLWGLGSAQPPPLPPRYGGFFGWYVGFHLVLLGVLIGGRWRARRGYLALFAAVTLVAALMPNQTILRYYMFWMIVLVSLNLMMPAATRQGQAPRTAGLRDTERLVGVVVIAALAAVVYATRGNYITPRVYRAEDLIVARRDPLILARVERGRASCLAGEFAPRVFLYAPLFNPGKDYRLKMGPIAGDPWERLGDCGPGWTLVLAERPDAGLLPPGYTPHRP